MFLLVLYTFSAHCIYILVIVSCAATSRNEE